jgi:hypothetical protein
VFCETGCFGRVVLGELPPETQRRLAAVPGEWLEFDPLTGAIVVRHCQPSSAPCLPTIASELERMLAEVPASQRPAIRGGDLYVHTESKGEFVRLRIQPGGDLRVTWAHPDYSQAERKAFTGHESLVPPQVQRLKGCVSLITPVPARAVQELEALADAYIGLYPEGELLASADERQGKVLLQLNDVNLDVLLLIKRLAELAAPQTLSGRIDVSAFAAVSPDHYARFLFEEGKVWVQRPALWEEPHPEQPRSVTPAAA